MSDNLYAPGVDGRTRTDAYRGRRFSVYTEAQKHRGAVVGVGLLALAAVAAWYGRGRIGAAARPAVRRAVRPLVLKAVRRRPAKAAQFAVRHPRQAMRVAAALR